MNKNQTEDTITVNYSEEEIIQEGIRGEENEEDEDREKEHEK